VVLVDIRKDWVDVNVHPQKTEVRCLRQETLYSWLLAAVRKAVARQPSVRPLGAFSEAPEAALSAPAFNARPLATPYVPPSAPGVNPWAPPATPRPVQTAFDQGEEFANRVAQTPAAISAPPEAPATRPLRQWKYLGQAKASYLVCEDPSGVILVDQHALHEKFRYEELRRQQEAKGLNSQRLLLPKVLRLPSECIPILEENAAVLSHLGFEIEPFGDGDWAITAIPELIEESRAEQVVLETLRAIAAQEESAEEVTARALTPILATLACHSVVRAGQTLSPTEAGALLDRLDAIEMGWTCPHGRPVAFRLPFGEIEKHFERK
ncbi:hypothetical protein K2X33_14695, partial [bacterium]|nr:hypothetical protein [bacterium]